MKICSLQNDNPLENADLKFSENNEEDVNKKPTEQKELRRQCRQQETEEQEI